MTLEAIKNAGSQVAQAAIQSAIENGATNPRDEAFDTLDGVGPWGMGDICGADLPACDDDDLEAIHAAAVAVLS